MPRNKLVRAIIGGRAYAMGATIIRNWKWIALALALAWGFRVDHLRGQYKQQREATRAEYRIFRATIQDMTAKALAKQKETAREADVKHQQEMADVRAATDRYIAAHRVRSKAGSNPGTTSPGSGAGVPESMPSDPIVAVADSDVHACSEAVKYAVDAHEWAIKVGE